jgi:hypothetical protein
MRARHGIRFAVLGAAGFGVGSIIAGSGILIPLGGAAGGALLGLALKDRRRAVILALLGALGATLGVLVTVMFGSPVWDSPGAMGAVMGATIGASLGVAFGDWKRVAALGVAGAVGFGLGGALAGDSPSSLLATGVLGGASLGGALGYFEGRAD